MFESEKPSGLEETRVAKITPEVVNQLIDKKILPTIKVIFFDEQGRISIYVSDKEKHAEENRSNFAGGGIDKDETATAALVRELNEELQLPLDIDFTEETVGNLEVLTYDSVRTTKPGWDAKGVFMTTMQVNSLEGIAPVEGELSGPHVFDSTAELKEWLWQSGTPIEQKKLYLKAIHNLEKSRSYTNRTHTSQ